jgi:hypothetical protein
MEYWRKGLRNGSITPILRSEDLLKSLSKPYGSYPVRV